VSAKRYAEAVFEIAKAGQRFDGWRADLASLGEAAKNADFVGLVESPRLSTDQKRAALKATLPGIGEEAVNLATVLFVKGRFAALAAPIAVQFDQMLDEDRGILRAEAVTAVELDAGRKDGIARTLSEATGRQVQVTYRVDPGIVGGMVVRLGDRVLDGSVSSHLRGLRRALGEAAG